MTIKIVYMNDHRDAVDNALRHLDKIYGMANTWYQETRRWSQEFDLQICRTKIGDSIIFQNEQDYLLWLLRFA